MKPLAALILSALPFAALGAEPLAVKGLAPGMARAAMESAHPGIAAECGRARGDERERAKKAAGDL